MPDSLAKFCTVSLCLYYYLCVYFKAFICAAFFLATFKRRPCGSPIVIISLLFLLLTHPNGLLCVLSYLLISKSGERVSEQGGGVKRGPEPLQFRDPQKQDTQSRYVLDLFLKVSLDLCAKHAAPDSALVSL